MTAPVSENPQFIGKTVKKSRGGVLDRFVSAVAQQDKPIRSAADAFLTPQQARQYGYKSDLANNVSIGARVAHQFRTGRMVGVPNMLGGRRRTVPLAPLANAFAKELSIDEQKLVGDALLARSAIDDYRRTGTLAALNFDKSGTPMDARTLDDFARRIESDPKYAKYMTDIRKSYADILEFKVARGLMSREAADAARAKRPNYVKFTRDLENDVPTGGPPRPFNANTDQGGSLARSTEQMGGVQGGAVGNPVNSIFDDWAAAIRAAEINDLRATFLQQMDAVAGNGIVRRVPNGITPDAKNGDHIVWRNGKQEAYHVSDPAISKALQYAPRASIQGLETLRQISQSVTTGPIGSLFNLFAVSKSTLYDTTLGTLLRPDGVKLGLLNEVLAGTGVSLGRFDPTAYLGAFTGAARYMWDDMRGAMAQNLTDQLMRDQSWLRSAIGDTRVTALRDNLAAAYENSIKSFMDENGITSLTMHGTPDPSVIMTNVDKLAPKFASDSAQMLYDETRRNGPGFFKDMLARDANGYAQLKSSAIARAYSGVLEAMHNGFRYSAVAANRSRNRNVEQLSSQMRRLSADAAQHGGSDNVNRVLGSLMYANLSVQTLHQTAMMIRANPASFMANLGVLGATAAALHYTALATDPKAMEQHKLKSAAQKTASMTTFGGAEIPIDPLLRIPFSVTFTLLDHLTGAHDGKWDGNFLKMFDNIISGDFDDEEYKEDAGEALWQAAKANNPIAPEAFPIANAALAYAGIDTGMSRITGEASPVRTQQLSGFDQNATMVDGMGTAYAENIVASLFGAAGDNLWRIADDASRAYGDTNSVGAAVGVGLSRYKDTVAKGSGVFKPMLFGQYEHTHAITDTNWQLMKGREEGVTTALNVLNKDIRGEGGTAVQHRTRMPLEVQRNTPAPEIQGTQLEMIAYYAQDLNKDLSRFRTVLNGIGKQVEGVRNGYTQTAEDKNKAINDLNERRRELSWQMLNLTRTYEARVREQIGDPDFTFDGFKPDDYMKPIAVNNADGTVSTVRSISIGTDAGEVLIPTVVNGKVVSDEEAIAHYQRTGKSLGTFRTPEEATAYAKALSAKHGQQLGH
jgi:hypothetical protein